MTRTSIEIVFLRHQLTVLQRQIDRPTLNEADRSLPGAVAAALPRARRAGWLVKPDRLLRWHRQRIPRHWTRPHRPAGRSPIAKGDPAGGEKAETGNHKDAGSDLVCDLARQG